MSPSLVCSHVPSVLSLTLLTHLTHLVVLLDDGYQNQHWQQGIQNLQNKRFLKEPSKKTSQVKYTPRSKGALFASQTPIT